MTRLGVVIISPVASCLPKPQYINRLMYWEGLRRGNFRVPPFRFYEPRGRLYYSTRRGELTQACGPKTEKVVKTQGIQMARAIIQKEATAKLNPM